jgi:ribosomal protein S12 methylthiotransferase
VKTSAEFSFYIISLGCSKNLTDSERINGSLVSAGFTISDSPEKADIIIINTCGFIEDAKKESIETIFDAIHYSKEHMTGRDKKIVVAGCLSQRYLQALKDDIPEIDYLYGVYDEHFVARLCEYFGIEVQKIDHMRIPLVEDIPFEYIKISEGCSNKCSYCAIPLIRGPHMPLKPESIMKDAREAAKRGCKEILIIAQDILSYAYDGMRLADLVNEISTIEGPEWIRLLYAHPDHMDPSVFDLLAHNSKVVPYLDIPFQHVSRDILTSMNRKGDYETYLSLVKEARDRISDIAVRSTFMVGYPGETEEHFQEVLQFLDEACLDRVGCFTYSQEEGTPAAELSDLPETVKRDRYDRFMQKQQEISRANLYKKIGTRIPVLIEEKIDSMNWIGRTMYDAPEVDGIFYLTSHQVSLHSIVHAEVTDAIDYDLIGVL